MKKRMRLLCGSLAGIMIATSCYIPAEATEETDEPQDVETAYVGGYIEFPEEDETPSIGDVSYFAALPRSFDARKNFDMPAVRNQKPYGVCWAFSSLGMGEIQLGNGTDLSELQLAYFTYHNATDPLGGTAGDSNALQDGENYMTTGGNLELAAKTLINWKGAVPEDVVPYSMAEDVLANGLDSSYAYSKDSVHLKNEYRINLRDDRDMVKAAIQQYGAVSTSYYADNEFYNAENNSYCSDNDYQTNHAILVVGWDDDFPKENFNSKPAENGAWLIRNSWGANEDSYGGYFWMSYDEPSLLGTAYVLEYTAKGSEDYYDNNYQYDGAIMSLAFSSPDAGVGGIKGANIFTAGASDYETLKAISFSTQSVNGEYTVQVYKDIQDSENPESGTLVAEQTGSTLYSGIYTVELDEEVPLKLGETYSVVVSLDGAQKQNFEMEALSYNESPLEVSGTIQPGQSFLTYGDYAWTDIAELGDVGNIRIKAFTNNTECPFPNIADQTIALDQSEYIYDGTAKEPVVTVKDASGNVLQKDVDYTVEYANNTAIGTATVTITGIGEYQGTAVKEFQIKAVSIETAEVSGIPSSVTYDGTAKTADISVTVAGDKLTKDTDYTVAYKDNTNAGTAIVTITGTGKYQGTITKTFPITAASIAQATVAGITTNVAYTGAAQTPEPAVTVGGKQLKKDTDYTVAYSNNTNIGTAKVTITGKGNYQGTITKNFQIEQASLKSAEISNIPASVLFSGKAQTPEPTVKLSGKTLVKGTDYTVAYSNNTNIGTAKVTITGKGNYKDIVEKTFQIAGKSIKSAKVSGIQASFTYDGTEKKPVPTVTMDGTTLKEGTDYTVSYKNNTNAGTAIAVITGKGNYSEVIEITFQITEVNISSATVSKLPTSVKYDGTAQTPEPTVTVAGKTLVKGTDYTVYYENNTNAGTAKVIITGIGNYQGTVTKTFQITGTAIDAATVSGIPTNVTYNRAAQTPEPTVKVGNKTLVKGTDYTVTYKNNVNVGKATVVITGKGNYQGTITKNFQIEQASLKSATISGIPASVIYNGTAQTPEPTVTISGQTLKKDVDYTVTYSNNSNAGTAKVDIAGKGNYKDSVSKTFMIQLKAGWQKIDDSWYYVNANGSMRTGWMQEGSAWYYLQPSDGKMAVGLQTINGYKYYFNTSGVMQTGWQKIDGTWYFFASGGPARTGWMQVGSTWYYMNPSDCKMAVGLQTIGGYKYYFNTSGAMQTGWQRIDGTWYFFASGGPAKTGWMQVGSTWYYMNPSDCKMTTGLKTIGNYKYYFNTSGAMQTGWQRIDGAWYFFASGGPARTGWMQVGSTWYYMNPSDCKMVTGMQTIGSAQYYFNTSGAMQTGWQQIDGNWYYFNAGGAMVKNQKVGNYYLGADGIWVK